MGYYTFFSLGLVQGDPEEYEKMLGEIADETGMDLHDGEQAKWYDYDEDMKRISARHSGLLVELSGDGEDADDHWRARYRGGESETVRMAFPAFVGLTDSRVTGRRKVETLEADIRERIAAFICASGKSVNAGAYPIETLLEMARGCAAAL